MYSFNHVQIYTYNNKINMYEAFVRDHKGEFETVLDTNISG